MYNKVKYCNQYKYDYIEDSDYPDQGCGKYVNKASQWYKIISILKHLDNYDYVLWSDVDTFIMNANFSLESYIDRYSEYHIICGGYEYEYDRMYNVPCLIHSGNFLIKNSIESKQILSTVFFNPKYYEWNNSGNHEEAAITSYLLNRERYWHLIKIINIKYLSSWLPTPIS